MIKKFILTIIYLIFFFNSNILSEENKKILKIGLLAPLTGQYSGLGNSILYSLQLALEELGAKNVAFSQPGAVDVRCDMTNHDVPESRFRTSSSGYNRWAHVHQVNSRDVAGSACL